MIFSLTSNYKIFEQISLSEDSKETSMFTFLLSIFHIKPEGALGNWMFYFLNY